MVVEHGGIEDLGDLPVRPRVLNELRSAVDVVRAEHDVHPRGLLGDDVAILLRQTPGHDDLATVGLGLPLLQPAEAAVQLVVGVLTNAARVQHDHISVVLGLHRHHAVGLEHASDALGVVLVHLAPEGAHEIRTGHAARVRSGDWRSRS